MKVVAGGIRTHFYVAGHGSPVVFVHGGGLGSDASSWLDTLDAVAHHRRAFALDTVGFGQSDAPDIDYSGERIVRHVVDFLDVLCLERVMLVGHSLGATIVARLAVRFPERVAAAVMVAPGGGALGLRYHSDGHVALERVLADPSRDNVRALAALMHAGDDGLDAETDRRLACATVPGHLAALRAYARASKTAPAESLERTLPESPVPLMLAWGRRERFNPADLGDRIAEKLPNLSRYAVFEHSGHYVQHDEPDKFTTTLNAFFDEVEAA
jgi:pimeloyl-ACP methyl ester carboxylesterase